MRLTIVVLAAATFAPSLLSQVTPEQRVQDFQWLVNLYARRYAPAEWKKQAVGFDLSNTTQWLERVREAKDHIEYHEIALEYVAMLEDSHSSYKAPGSASANLGFSVDIYDGKVLIESIDRSRLPVAEYPFAIGDELVFLDGRTAEEWMSTFRGSAKWEIRRRPCGPAQTDIEPELKKDYEEYVKTKLTEKGKSQ